MENATILAVEDDRSVASMLYEMLKSEGFTVLQAFNGETALEKALYTPPDLVLLDLLLPGMNGLDVLQRLRATPRAMHVPVIMLTACKEKTDKIQALKLHVNGYLTKPFDNDELLASIHTHLYHAHTALRSPLTGLPGGTQIELALQQRFLQSQPWALLFFDLDNFKALNDGYGFWHGNEMIRLLARIITEAVRDGGNTSDFVGHIGGEDFIVLSTPSQIHALCHSILDRFARASRQYYRPDDLARGGFMAMGRDGGRQLFPLVTLSIAVLLSERIGAHATFSELSQRVAVIKARSKEVMGNCYVIDGEEMVYAVTGASSIS